MAGGQRVVLDDGRTLAFADVGDPDGAPVIFLHGAQSSSAEAVAFDALAREHGIRFLATDRAGSGGSSPHPARTFLGHARDLEQLADSLGLGQVVVAGMSNGGAYALAAAHALGDRVRGVVIINSTTPVADRAARRALGPAARLAYASMGAAPRLLGRRLARRVERAERAGDTARGGRRAVGPDAAVLADPAIVAIQRQGAADASLGPHGAAYLTEELSLAVAPWGFDHRALRQRVEVVTGDRDAGAPYARRWVEELPDAGLHVFPGGHGSYLAPAALAEIVRTMAALVGSDPIA